MVQAITKLPRHLAAAWDAERADPVGILVPAGALLAMQAAAALALQRALGVGGWDAVVVVLAAALVVRVLAGAPLRAALLVAGAGALGAHARARWVPLLGVHLVVGVAQVGWVSICVAGGVAAGALVLGYGWPTTGAFVAFVGVACAALGALGIRSVAAYAPAEVLIVGASALGGLRASVASGPGDWLAAAFLLAAGDLLIGIGALVCGAGALPGYPISDLAVLHRWHTRAP